MKSFRSLSFFWTDDLGWLRAGAFLLLLLILVADAASYAHLTRTLDRADDSAALAQARALAGKDLALRLWAMERGAVYVPVSPETPPNPFLTPEGRELALPSGETLTRLNPEYLTRLAQERWSALSGLNAHLTSLKPLHPQNFADAWESAALLSLAQTGDAEYAGLIPAEADDAADAGATHGRETFRLMLPLRTEPSCLSCHGAQGYQPGDIQGGLSVSFPREEASAYRQTLQRALLWSHAGFAVLAALGIALFSRALLRRNRERIEAVATLKMVTGSLEQRVADRTAQLEREQARSRRLLTALSSGLILLDPIGRITRVNEAALATLGYGDENELLGKSLHAMLRYVDSQGRPIKPMDCTLCVARASGTARTFRDELLLRKDGSPIFVDGSIAPIAENTLAEGSLLSFFDVSGFHNTAALQSMVFDNSQEPFLVWDKKLAMVNCNEAARAFFGVASAEDFNNPSAVFFPEYQENGQTTIALLRGALRRCRKYGQTRFTLLVRHASGRLTPCEASLTKISYRHFNGYCVSLHDLQAVKEYERTLTRERKLLDDVIEASPSAMLIFGEDQRIRRANRAALLLTGLDEGSSAGEAWVNPDDWEDLAGRALHGDPAESVPLRFYGKDRQALDVLASLSLVRHDAGADAWLLWLQDVTDLVAAREEALASTRAKNDFLGQMGHEIRTPMNAILGMTYLLQQTPLSEAQAHYAARTQSAARSLLALISDILDFSKIEADALPLENVSFYLPELFKNLGDLLMRSAEEKGLELLHYLDPAVPEFLVGDPLRLSQVLINLTNNALKFTESGEVFVLVRLLSQEDAHMELEFQVSDTGIGMNAEQIGRLFLPFQRVHETVARKYGGTGLGLAICARLVRLMGGGIRVESQPGKGSRFTFTVRLLRDATVRGLGKPYAFRGERVLVVDDNPISRGVLSDMLRDLGCRPATASSGAEALEKIRLCRHDDPYTLILLDWKMPGMDGMECARRIRSLPEREKLPQMLMVSAFGLEEYRKQGEALGFTDYLAKPVDRLELGRALTKAYGKDVPGGPDAPAAPETPAEAPAAGTRVLLVEDNESNQEVGAALLSGLGLDVTLAANGLEAVKACEEQRFALVFMDIEMPVMDGLKAAGLIRDIPGRSGLELPIVAMTAHALPEDRARSLEAGMNDYLSKPIDPAELAAMLRKWIRPGGTGQGADGENVIILPQSLPGIDMKEALGHVGGKTAALARHLQRFAEEYRAWPDQFYSSVLAGRFEDAALKAHTLRGLAATLGAAELADHAFEVETLCGDSDECLDALERLRAHLNKVCDGVDTAFCRRRLKD